MYKITRFYSNVIMESLLIQDLQSFEQNLKDEDNFETYLDKLRTISNRFSLPGDDNILNSCFAVILGLVEQYTHELLAKPGDNVQSRGLYTAT